MIITAILAVFVVKIARYVGNSLLSKRLDHREYYLERSRIELLGKINH